MSDQSNALALIEKPNQSITPAEMRKKILELEAMLLQMPPATPGTFGRIEMPVTHHFAPGVYMRELFIPKGTLLTGKIHRTEHLNILAQGEIVVITEDGPKRLKASTVIKSQPGIKRVGYALEDSVWITVHHNLDECRDPDLIEERLTARTFEEIPELAQREQIEGG